MYLDCLDDLWKHGEYFANSANTTAGDSENRRMLRNSLEFIGELTSSCLPFQADMNPALITCLLLWEINIHLIVWGLIRPRKSTPGVRTHASVQPVSIAPSIVYNTSILKTYSLTRL